MPSKRKKTPSRTAATGILSALARRKLMTHAELLKAGATGTQLGRMANAGLITAVGSGIYASTALDPFVAAVLATAKYYPNAVISGLTALQIHNLALEYIQKVDVDVPRETSIRNKMLQVHRIPKSRLVGIIALKYEGTKIRIYDLERSLCEAFKIDAAGPIFFKALKRYVALGKVNPDRIKKYDLAVKTHVLAHLQQELASA